MRKLPSKIMIPDTTCSAGKRTTWDRQRLGKPQNATTRIVLTRTKSNLPSSICRNRDIWGTRQVSTATKLLGLKSLIHFCDTCVSEEGGRLRVVPKGDSMEKEEEATEEETESDSCAQFRV